MTPIGGLFLDKETAGETIPIYYADRDTKCLTYCGYCGEPFQVGDRIEQEVYEVDEQTSPSRALKIMVVHRDCEAK